MENKNVEVPEIDNETVTASETVEMGEATGTETPTEVPTLEEEVAESAEEVVE